MQASRRSPCNFIIWAILCTVLVLQVSAQNVTTVNSTSITPSATTPAAAATATITPTTMASPATTERPVATVQIEAETKITGTTYTPALNDKSSSEFKAFNEKFTKSIQDAIGNDADVHINGIRSGSIIVNYTVTLKVTPGVDPVKQLTEIIKSGKLGNFSVDKTFIAFVGKFPGVTLGEYKLNTKSYQAYCCKKTVTQFDMVRPCTASGEATCNGIKVTYKLDCGSAEGPPTCSKAGTLTNMSVAIMILGYIFSKILA